MQAHLLQTVCVDGGDYRGGGGGGGALGLRPLN